MLKWLRLGNGFKCHLHKENFINHDNAHTTKRLDKNRRNPELYCIFLEKIEINTSCSLFAKSEGYIKEKPDDLTQ